MQSSHPTALSNAIRTGQPMRGDLILVTGGAGFIGSHLCEGLIAEGYRVRVLDDLSVGKAENIPTGCDFVEGSVLQEEIVQRAMNGVSAVCHEAARVTIRGSIKNFYDDADTNLMGTLRVLKVAGDLGVRRFIYASSMAIYSDCAAPDPVPENYSTIPISPYGVAKLAAEQYLLLIAPQLGIQPVVLRYFNTFGTRQGFTPYVGVVTIFITRLLQKQPITIFGDGEQVRDFVHVSDIVQANLLSLRAEAAGEILNVGTGRGTSVNQIANLLKERLYPEASVSSEPARAEELRNSIANISRAKARIGYQPKTDLKKQIAEVIEYLKRQTV